MQPLIILWSQVSCITSSQSQSFDINVVILSTVPSVQAVTVIIETSIIASIVLSFLTAEVTYHRCYHSEYRFYCLDSRNHS
jgi:hypothetical protein